MADIAFALDLGGGLYLDSNGDLHQGTPPEAPIYQAPFSLPVDPKAIKNTLDAVQKALKDINKDASVTNLFEEYGLPFRLLNILSVVGKIAGIVAPVFAVASFAVDVLKLFGVLKDGPSALELLVKQRFDQLDAEVKSIATLIQVKDLRDGRVAVEDFSSQVKDYVDQLQGTNPSLAQLESDRATLMNGHQTHIDAIKRLVDQARHRQRAAYRRRCTHQRAADLCSSAILRSGDSSLQVGGQHHPPL